VDYFKPGACLARAVAEQIDLNPLTNIVFLKNHGVVIGGNSVEEIDLTLCSLLDRFPKNPEYRDSDLSNVSSVVEHQSKFTKIDFLEVHNLALNEDLFNMLEYNWALYPDHVVFLGPFAHAYSCRQTLIDDLEGEVDFDYFILKGEGVYTKSNIDLAKKLQLLCYYNILIRQPNDIKLNVLNSSEVSELLNWDAEKYRTSIRRV